MIIYKYSGAFYVFVLEYLSVITFYFMRYIMFFTKNLYKLLLIGTVLVGGSMNIESTTLAGLPREITENHYISDILQKIDFANVISSTVSVDKAAEGTPLYSIDADNAYGGSDLPIDWNKVYQFALRGNPVAQYIHGNRCLSLATKLYNGECIQKKFEAYMFLLISAIKGKFQDSKDDFTYIADISGLETKFELIDVIKLAKEFSMRL